MWQRVTISTSSKENKKIREVVSTPWTIFLFLLSFECVEIPLFIPIFILNKMSFNEETPTIELSTQSEVDIQQDQEQDQDESATNTNRLRVLSNWIIKSCSTKEALRKIFGMICILTVVILWVLGGVAIQFIYGDLNYDKPFFVTYVSTSLFSVYLLGFIFIGSWRRPLIRCIKWLGCAIIKLLVPREYWPSFVNNTIRYHIIHSQSVVSQSSDLIVEQKSMEDGSITTPKYENDVDVGKTFRLSLVVTFFWFFSNTAYNYALSYTSVASDTIISNTSCLFTFLFGLLIGVETHFSFLRFVLI